MIRSSYVQFILGCFLSPLLLGIINRVKAYFAGRQGPPLFQIYFDLWKLFQKDSVYSQTTTWVFRAGPIVGLAATLVAMLFIPSDGMNALISFPGDFIFFAYLFALARFFTIAAALDTGSSFEGMGASREAQYAIFSEVALLLAVTAIAVVTGSFSISDMARTGIKLSGLESYTIYILAGVALMIVLLAENARIPVDDPNTHLELTMIHEVMVLDHGGVDLGFILYTDALKLWTLGSLATCIIFPFHLGKFWLDIIFSLGLLFGISVFIGIVESTMARLRLYRIPHLLMGAIAASVLAIGLVFM